MHALDKKLLRDFQRLWSQALAIALVLACGVMILLTSYGMYRALDDTLNAFYERNNFAHVWASAEKVPRQVLGEIGDIRGVQSVDGRVRQYLILDIPGRTKSATGLALSLPADGGLPVINVPIVRSGRLPDPRSSSEVLVSEPFAEANGFTVGDTFQALLSGRKRKLTISGTALSPEFVYAIGPGSLVPDDAAYGVLWLPDAMLSAAFDMADTVNYISLTLSRDTRIETVVTAVDAVLEQYGGIGAHGRDTQESHAFVASEISSLRAMAMILPPIFFGISAFLVNMVIGRLILLERAEIGLLKALGYTDIHIAAHYVLLAGLTAIVGIAIGWITGGLAGRGMAALYAQYFKFPYLIYNVSYDAYAVSGFLALLTAAAGAVRSAHAAASLPPAVAMSPPAPPKFNRSAFDRLLTALRLSQPTMMIWRSIIRWPVRASLSALGLSLAVAVMVSVGFFSSSIDEIVDVAFNQSNRQDASLLFTTERPQSVLEDVKTLPGVLEVEGELQVPVKLRNQHHEKQIAITTRAADATLGRSVDDFGKPVIATGTGILLTDRVAQELGVRPGDMIDVEFTTGRQEIHRIPVSGTVTQYFGIGAYMSREGVSRLTRAAPVLTMANVTLDPDQDSAFNTVVKSTPAIAGVVRVSDMKSSFLETLDQNIMVTNSLFTVIAVLITIGLTYNGARIQLSERARELASLRILGFSRTDVSYILIGETMIVAVAAQPLGWVIGYGISRLMSEAISSDLYAIPLALPASAYAKASLVVLVTALASVLFVRRRIDRLDLVAVMKTRE